ncbi:hypothetical protein EQO05_13075 [Methanosarcina sp. MSH10X1]|uniref:hypothetical protein n=1 Tax=Methanosarcina sp. MSH10X1 TaxID=2507075 RepID=UPI000FFC7E16|nr:hypothetical protein [Methanosarcina sp. MSH10X1]RXA16926.1 hypothetical protein EQO05_13075 [Methanosarcina sp. MSH10X1]
MPAGEKHTDRQKGWKAMNEARSRKDGVKGERAEQPRGRWMAPGIGAGAVLGILFGSFVLGPAMDSQTTGYILGMSIGVAIGLVSGLSLSSGPNHK